MAPSVGCDELPSVTGAGAAPPLHAMAWLGVSRMSAKMVIKRDKTQTDSEEPSPPPPGLPPSPECRRHPPPPLWPPQPCRALGLARRQSLILDTLDIQRHHIHKC